MDLLRPSVVTVVHAMADRFIEEASKRVAEIDDTFRSR